MMERRTFLVMISGGLLTAPPAAEAQPAGKVWRIGNLSVIRVPSIDHAFLDSLREIGYVDGVNAIIEYRDANGDVDRLPALADELVRMNVDVIIAWSTAAQKAAKQATSTVPIVMGLSTDPVGTGLVKNLARPGGNITGPTLIGPELAGKRLQLLKESFPRISRLAVLWSPGAGGSELEYKETQSAAKKLGVAILSVETRRPEEIGSALSALTQGRTEALIVLNYAMLVAHRQEVVDLAMKSRLPTMYPRKEFVEAGGLMSYGPSFVDLARRVAVYVDKILKGAKPGDLPVEQPSKFELVINLKTAKAFSLTIPPSVLVRADQIIE